MDTLTVALERIRARDGLSVAALARRLGVGHSTLIMLRQGKRHPGEKLLRAIMHNLPELTPVVLHYLQNGHDTD